jgi:uncharacterized protein
MSEFYEKLKTYVGREVGDAMAGPDDVNVAMIRHWCEAMGDTNPIYTDPEAAAHSVHGGIVAPPTMLQAWVMRPFGSGRPAPTNNPYVELLALLDTDFPSVVATNCEQTYNRYLRPGDKISMRTVIDSVSEEKTTGLGTGHFVTSRQDYYANDGELVGSMLFRILRFRPAQKAATARSVAPEGLSERSESEPTGAGGAPAPERKERGNSARPRPSTSADQGWHFDAMHNDGKFLVQKCTSCGTVRYPTGPMCRSCNALAWEPVEVSPHGTVYSFVVTHYPVVPSFDYPLPIVLVDLPVNGTTVRVVGNAIDCDPAAIVVGQPAELVVQRVDDTLSLPFFRVTTGAAS